MTSVPARVLGVRDRGVIAVGAAADLVVFDPATIEDRATYDEPHQYPTGISLVMVNGKAVVDGGQHTGVRPGHALRRPPAGG
jgi:N-acyl-D-aspartate/D-glutamate deacylase